jgi:hypothetical protein
MTAVCGRDPALPIPVRLVYPKRTIAGQNTSRCVRGAVATFRIIDAATNIHRQRSQNDGSSGIGLILLSLSLCSNPRNRVGTQSGDWRW